MLAWGQYRVLILTLFSHFDISSPQVYFNSPITARQKANTLQQIAENYRDKT